jgi:hypothetical protein
MIWLLALQLAVSLACLVTFIRSLSRGLRDGAFFIRAETRNFSLRKPERPVAYWAWVAGHAVAIVICIIAIGAVFLIAANVGIDFTFPWLRSH